MLTYFGAFVTTATSAEEAIDIGLRIRPDVVITDLRLGGTPGTWLRGALRSYVSLRRLPVVAPSGRVELAAGQRAPGLRGDPRVAAAPTNDMTRRIRARAPYTEISAIPILTGSRSDGSREVSCVASNGSDTK
jgi:CheY-like chemotaxis protein